MKMRHFNKKNVLSKIKGKKYKGAGTLVDVLQLSYSFHQNWSKLGTAITEDHKN
jgi:hypothetical protein